MLTKNQVIATLDNLPDKFTLDEVMQRMYVLNKIEMARAKSKKGKIFSSNEARKKAVEMVKIRWNEESLADIDEIAEYIAEDSITYAMIQVENFFYRVEILKNTPRSGTVVPELNDENVRQLIEGNYRIIYEIKSNSLVEVLCVIHGMRLLHKHPTFKRKK